MAFSSTSFAITIRNGKIWPFLNVINCKKKENSYFPIALFEWHKINTTNLNADAEHQNSRQKK